MPLPQPPTRRPNNAATRQSQRKADNELLFRGVLCVLIGAGVLLWPYFTMSSSVQDMLQRTSIVGWFALLLGCGYVAVFARRRIAASGKI